MHDAARHPDRWRRLHREVIQDLEEELERLRLRESDLQQAALERELVLLELLEVERVSRLTAAEGAGAGPAAAEADRGAGPGNASRADAGARAAELRTRLALTDPRIPELESALRAREELAHLRSRAIIRALYALVKLKRRLLGRR